MLCAEWILRGGEVCDDDFLGHAVTSEAEGDVPKRSLWERIKDIAMMDVAVLARRSLGGLARAVEQLLLEADFAFR
jgi:hypothetical protein